MKNRLRLLPILALFSLYLVPLARAAEPWADPKLPVTEGLFLWFDAGSQQHARAEYDARALEDGSPIDIVFDGSGNQQHVKPTTESNSPVWVRIDKSRDDKVVSSARHGTVLRFDGLDDHLRAVGLGTTIEDFTIFIVGAPHSNPGLFRGLLAANAHQSRDYESGLTIDLHSHSSTQFEFCNVEGKGFGGAVDLLNKQFPFGRLTVLEVSSMHEALVVNLLVDGELTGQRPRTPGKLSFDEITVGARFYTNGSGPQEVRGSLQGDIAEIIVFSRALGRSEAAEVNDYLQQKWRRVRELLPRTVALGGDSPLVTITDPPAVQMLLPGFDVRELPVDLPNINNVRYRPDGRLVALTYNGDILLLSDSDGDLLEDRIDEFWTSNGQLRAPIGMALTPPNYPPGNGVFVASKGKLSLIVDKDGDDRAEEEVVVAKGWKELPHGVDALGVAVDPNDGSLFFGLGSADYTNAYQVDAQGKSHYRLDSDRGTIQRVSADFKQREIYCTGIRFPVGMAFNGDGDLFCTDQEGATWLPNGNPFDELLHIQRGRHYGFPPRHPRHLPDVIDEPSTFDYKPQHQSTCGMFFNFTSQSGVQFGPASWRDDAIVCGYSRGKLFRTSLAKTDVGYVAKSQVIGCLNQLTVDAAVSPIGQLVVATHSGPPDWGTGPEGRGKLYQITYRGDVPMPIAVWPIDRTTVAVAFDRELDPAGISDLAKRCRIVGGPYVQAGDQYESLKPPYEAVQRQMQATRVAVPVHAVQLSTDRKQLILTTGPHDVAYTYALTIAEWLRPKIEDIQPPLLIQYPTIDLAYDLTGVAVRSFVSEQSKEFTGRMAFADFHLSRAWPPFTESQSEFWKSFAYGGEVTLSCQLDLRDMLRPKVQPGSRIDYELPSEKVTLVFRSNCGFFVTLGNQKLAAGKDMMGQRLLEAPVDPDWVNLSVSIIHGPELPAFAITYYTEQDSRERGLSPQRIFVPWAQRADSQTEITPAEPIRLQVSGNWSRGKKIFNGNKAQCAKCHSMHEPAGKIGAPLGNLFHRDVNSVLRDIQQPNFAINPDFVTYTIQLNDGRVLTGIPRTEGDRLVIGNQQGELITTGEDDVDVMQPSPLSTMPEGLLKDLSEQDVNDLLTFLLTPPPRMPVYAPNPPAPRLRDELNAVLAGGNESSPEHNELRIVLVAGPKDHGPGEHDYPAWRDVWTELLSAVEHVQVETAELWPNAEQLTTADVLVFFQQGRWDEQRAKDLDTFLARGGGAVYLHYAVDGGNDPPGFADRIGLAWQGGLSKFRHGALDIDFDNSASPLILRNFHRLHFEDESYWQLVGDPKNVRVLGAGIEDGAPQPLFWTAEPKAGGRVFVSILGHYSWTFDDPLFRVLILRGIAWSADEDVDRFNEIVTFGANVAD